MSDLLLVTLSGIITAAASITGAIVGARLGSRYEAHIRWINRPRPTINDIWLSFGKGGNPYLQIKNIGKTSAKNITFEEVVFDNKKTLLQRDMWVKENNGNGKDLHPMQYIDIRWISYNSEMGILTFPSSAGDKTFSLDEISFPITGRIELFALDSESQYYEYMIRLLHGQPYIQKWTNVKQTGFQYPESIFDDRREDVVDREESKRKRLFIRTSIR